MALNSKKSTHGGLAQLLGGEHVRRTITEDGRTLFAAVDLVEHLSGSRHPAEYWADLKVREPGLARLFHSMTYSAVAEAVPVALDGVDLEGVLRLVQSVPTARAERVRRWLAQTARERLEEEKN